MTAFAVQIGIKNRKEGRKTICSILFVFRSLMRRVARRPEALRRGIGSRQGGVHRDGGRHGAVSIFRCVLLGVGSSGIRF